MYILALTGLQEDKEQDWRRDSKLVHPTHEL